MRTTLDIDDVVLSAARALAATDRISLGRAVSELALRGMRGPAAAPVDADLAWPGFVALTGFTPEPAESARDRLAAMDDELDADHARAGLDD